MLDMSFSLLAEQHSTIYSHSLGLDSNQLQEHVSLFSKAQQRLFIGTLACSVRLLKSLIFFLFFEEGRRTKLRVPGTRTQDLSVENQGCQSLMWRMFPVRRTADECIFLVFQLRHKIKRSQFWERYQANEPSFSFLPIHKKVCYLVSSQSTK